MYMKESGVQPPEKTEDILKYQTMAFDELTLNQVGENHLIMVKFERRIIKKGNSTRVKFLFDNSQIECIEIENVGKTTLYKVNIHKKELTVR